MSLMDTSLWDVIIASFSPEIFRHFCPVITDLRGFLKDPAEIFPVRLPARSGKHDHCLCSFPAVAHLPSEKSILREEGKPLPGTVERVRKSST